jgi:hypothetical protein
MADCIFIGNGVKVAQVITLTVGGTIETTDKFHVNMGTKRLTVVAGSTDAATVATAIATAWNALSATDYPEFAEITALATGGGNLTLTADNPGRAFAVTLLTVETNDAAADDQTFSQAATVANAGPEDYTTLANWSGGALPANGDNLYLDGSIYNGAIKYGLDQSAVTVASLVIRNGWTGTIGLPERNKDHSTQYDEYRETSLKIGATALDMDCASSRIKINVGSVQTAIVVRRTGTARDAGTQAFQWFGTHASNTLEIRNGSVGVAMGATQTATVATLTQSGGSCRCSVGTTVKTINKTGGTLALEGCPATAVTSLRGTFTGDSPLQTTV